jgi:hypothetical protein
MRPPQPVIPKLPQIGERITGQRKQIERFDFKGERRRGVRIAINQAERFVLPRGVILEVFTDDQIPSGGFGGVVGDIDTSDPKIVRVLVRAAKK